MPDATQQSQTSRIWSRVKTHCNTAWKQIRRIGQSVYNHVAQVVGYYRSNQLAFKEYLSEFAVGLQSARVRRREIRISAEDDVGMAWYSKDGWHVNLPDCCVVCGEPAQRDWTQETVHVPDVAWPFWAPIVGFVGGFVLMLLAQWFWLWPIGLLLGFLYGYNCRESERVVLRYRRCDRHMQATRIPHLRLFSEFLIVRVGHRSVKQLFQQAQHSGSSALDQTAAGEPSPSEFPTIPLDGGDVDGEIRHDNRERLKGYPGESESFPFRTGDSIPLEEPESEPKPATLREHEPEPVYPTGEESGDERGTVPLADAPNGDKEDSGRQSVEKISPAIHKERYRCPSCGTEVVLQESRCPQCHADL